MTASQFLPSTAARRAASSVRSPSSVSHARIGRRGLAAVDVGDRWPRFERRVGERAADEDGAAEDEDSHGAMLTEAVPH